MMSTENEFIKWLQRPEKCLKENFQFALKAWRSAEFTLSNKYELIFKWLVQQNGNITNNLNEFPIDEFRELLQLRAQPSWVTQQTKIDFIEMILSIPSSLNDNNLRLLPELLYNLCEFELMQDLLRTDYKIMGRLYGQLFSTYEMYLQSLTVESIPKTIETEFFIKNMTSLMDRMKKAINQDTFLEQYTDYIVQPLIADLLLLENYDISFNNEFYDLERVMSEQLSEKVLLQRILDKPFHIKLLLLEASIVNRRGIETYIQMLINGIFYNDNEKNESTKKQQNSNKIDLTMAAYTLKMLHKHEINLNFYVKEESVLSFIGKKLYYKIAKYKSTHLREVLMLLCSAIHVNPLILEENIIEYTIWMIMADKENPEEQQLFENYLQLLLDMFRRLSRSEKLVVNLLKALQQWLKHNDLKNSYMKKGKRKLSNASKMDCEIILPKKRNKDKEGEKENNVENKALEGDVQYAEILARKYLNLMEIADCWKRKPWNSIGIATSFPELLNYWPSATVGLDFSKLLTSLMTKPSLVIWKTLLYSFKELFENLNNSIKDMELEQQQQQQPMKANDLFLLELHAALLCQYFVGTRVIEQYDKYTKEINELRAITSTLLQTFLKYLMSSEHLKRTMNAFLECAYYFGNFNLLLHYYKPDGNYETEQMNTDDKENDNHSPLNTTNIYENLHSFLPANEWQLIEQRILNFGETTCTFLLNRLVIQRKQAELLLLNVTSEANTKPISIKNSILYTNNGDDDVDAAAIKANDKEYQLYSVVTHNKRNINWLLKHMKHKEKILLAKIIIENHREDIHLFKEDMDMLELMLLQIYEGIISDCKAKTSLMVNLKCDFELLKQKSMDINTMDKYIMQLFGIVNEYANTEYQIKKLSKDAILNDFALLKQLPIGHLRRQYKLIVFILQLAIYSDLKICPDTNTQQEMQLDAFAILKDLLHFGHQIAIFRFISTSNIIKLFPINDCWPLYEYIFTAIHNDEKGIEHFLTGLQNYINEIDNDNTSKLNNEQLRILLTAIETLGNLTGQSSKRLRKYLDKLLDIYGNYVNKHFKTILKDTTNNAKKSKKFVERTLQGFAYYAKSMLTKFSIENETNDNVNNEAKSPEFEDEFRQICKIYIGHSMDYRNPHAIRLINVALNYRKQLHLDQVEIEFVLSGYWHQLLNDLRQGLMNSKDFNMKNTEIAVKLIIDHKTNEGLVLTLKNIGKNIHENDFINVVQLLTLIGKSSFSVIKGAIFNDEFKKITADISLRFTKGEQQQFTNLTQVVALLTAQQTLTENRMIPISLDSLDSILCMLMEINIKKFQINDNNTGDFMKLHAAATMLCTALIKQRHLLLMDRIPQFMHIFSDLMQAIVWYKCDRQKNARLDDAELNDLSELAMQLEALMHIITTHSVAFKRVAPFVLIYIISLMVADKRATTLYPKIKTHVDSICYDLIGICDHRAGHFILRNSNEPARGVYETLVKEYQKYHKFKGKI